MALSINAPEIATYSAVDDRRLSVRIWTTKAPVARVVLLHGIISHGGWYEHLAVYLRNAHFEVHFLDRRGSGLNAESPGDVDHWCTWTGDVAQYLESLRGPPDSREDELPLVLGGISWGGKLAAAVARLYPGLLNALVLICPGIYSRYMPGFVKRSLLSIPLFDALKQRRLKIPLQRADMFTRSPRWRRFIDEDPLALRTITLRFAQQDLLLTRFARGCPQFIHCPLLMMLAGSDRILDNKSIRAYFSQIASQRKTLVEYTFAAHTLEFERDSNAYFADLADWIKRLANRPARESGSALLLRKT